MAENFFFCVSKDLRRKFTNFASVKRALRLFFYAVQILVKNKKTLSSVKIVVSFKNEFFWITTKRKAYKSRSKEALSVHFDQIKKNIDQSEFDTSTLSDLSM